MKRGIKKALFYDISYNTVLMKSWVIKLFPPTPLCTLWQHEGEMSRGSIEDTALIVQKQKSSDWLRWHEDDDIVCAHKTLEGAAFTPVRERATFPTLTLNKLITSCMRGLSISISRLQVYAMIVWRRRRRYVTCARKKKLSCWDWGLCLSAALSDVKWFGECCSA